MLRTSCGAGILPACGPWPTFSLLPIENVLLRGSSTFRLGVAHSQLRWLSDVFAPFASSRFNPAMARCCDDSICVHLCDLWPAMVAMNPRCAKHIKCSARRPAPFDTVPAGQTSTRGPAVRGVAPSPGASSTRNPGDSLPNVRTGVSEANAAAIRPTNCPAILPK